MTRLRPGRLVERRFQNGIAHVVGQRPRKPCSRRPPQRLAQRRRRCPDPNRNRFMAQSLLGPISQYLADTPHLQSLRRHPVPSPSPLTEGTSHRQNTHATPHPKGAASSRNKGATNSRNWGRDHFGIRGRIASEFAAAQAFDPRHHIDGSRNDPGRSRLEEGELAARHERAPDRTLFRPPHSHC